MKKFFWLFLALIPLVFLSCNGEDKKAPAVPPVSDLFLDYKVTAEEGAEYAVVLLYFRKAGAESKSVVLEPGSQVSFDGEPLIADSARLAGVYYEVQRPLAGFAGQHVIIYKDKEGKVYEHPFTFTPLTLKSIPPILPRQDLPLQLGATGQGSTVQVVVTDTSFKTADINEEYKANNGQIVITREALQKVANGPITLELIKEQALRLPNGRLVIHYTLRRELELK